VLFMPKEHYPLLPLLPPPTFTALFEKGQAVANAISKAMLVQSMNIFVANGAAAGQQANHVMIHLIPRENNDDLENFTIPSKDLSETEILKPKEALAYNLGVMMGNHFKRNPAPWHDLSKDKTGSIPQTFTPEQVIMIIEKNPEIKKAIKEDPDAFEKLIKEHEQLRMIFKDVSYNQILQKLGVTRKKDKKKESSQKNKEEVNLDNISDLL